MDKTYLMWVGADNYPTIKDWVDEVDRLGISKRLPNIKVGEKLATPGTVIFVAHDEGERKDCPDCVGEIENPDWRKREERLVKLFAEIAQFEKERDELGDSINTVPGEFKDYSTIKKRDSINRKIIKRETKIKELQDIDLPEKITGGTGGTVKLTRSDTANYVEEVVDYRKYDYWHHQPKKFAKRWQKIGEPNMCKTCGGKGQLPEAKIFGLFVPSCVEYVLKPADSSDIEKRLSEKGISSKRSPSSAKRKCGYQKEGGVYAIADSDGINKKINKIVKKLVDSGKVAPEAVSVRGDFVEFLVSFPVPEKIKRFRGIARFNVKEGSDLEEASEMCIDALE